MIKLINKSDLNIEIVSDMPVELANALRRSVNYIPVLAIDAVEISKNDSALYDEVIAHRLGLIPLKDEGLKTPEGCGCGKEDGCGKCSMKLKLSASKPGVIYSTEMSPKGTVIYKMPITILDKEQKLEFVATARAGTGVQHAKYSPGMIYYCYEDDADKEDDDSFKKIVENSKKAGDKKIILSVESWGQISSKEMFIKAVDALNEEIKSLLKKIK